MNNLITSLAKNSPSFLSGRVGTGIVGTAYDFFKNRNKKTQPQTAVNGVYSNPNVQNNAQTTAMKSLAAGSPKTTLMNMATSVAQPTQSAAPATLTAPTTTAQIPTAPPKTREQELQEMLDNTVSAANIAKADAEAGAGKRGITAPFVQGEQAAIERQALSRTTPITQELSRITEQNKALAESSKPFELSEGQARYAYDPATGGYKEVASRGKTYKTGSVGAGGGLIGGIGGFGGTKSTSDGSGDLLDIARGIESQFPTKFALESYRSNINRLAQKGDNAGLANEIRLQVIRNSPLGQEQKNQYVQNIQILKQLDTLDNILGTLEKNGVNTGLLSGSRQAILNKLGKIGDKDLTRLATTALDITDRLGKMRSGAALSSNEEKLYSKLTPGLLRGRSLNSQVSQDLRSSLRNNIDSFLGMSLPEGSISTVESYTTPKKGNNNELLSKYGL